jgi:5'-3' exonuclease
MGIPYYVASLLRQHKHLQQDVGNAALEVDVLGIDFNCFIHKYLETHNPIGSIVLALEHLLTTVVRARHVYIALDGLVPYSKIVQQRYRRFRKQEATEFDKHQISPGTPFMRQLERTLKFMFPGCTISGTDEPGEGEHKIFTWLRTFPPEQRRKICIYGLDADLVLISMAQSHLGDIWILREKEDNSFSTFSISGLKSVLPIDPDTFVKMSVLCFGNDFMPPLAMFSLREEGYNRALHYFKHGIDLEKAAKDEVNVLKKRSKETDRHIVALDGYALEQRVGNHLMDGVVDWEQPCVAFWKTYAWTLKYFQTSEVSDWCWYYPYPEAPLVQTLVDFPSPEMFEWQYPSPPYGIQDQLQFILPERSLKEFPSIYPDELYNEETETRHKWMKRFAWECDPFMSLPWNPLFPPTSVAVIPDSSGEIQTEAVQSEAAGRPAARVTPSAARPLRASVLGGKD